MDIGGRLVGLSLAGLIVCSPAAAQEGDRLVVRLYNVGRLPTAVVAAAASLVALTILGGVRMKKG